MLPIGRGRPKEHPNGHFDHVTSGDVTSGHVTSGHVISGSSTANMFELYPYTTYVYFLMFISLKKRQMNLIVIR
jgi:hypothetical protein